MNSTTTWGKLEGNKKLFWSFFFVNFVPGKSRHDSCDFLNSCVFTRFLGPGRGHDGGPEVWLHEIVKTTMMSCKQRSSRRLFFSTPRANDSCCVSWKALPRGKGETSTKTPSIFGFQPLVNVGIYGAVVVVTLVFSWMKLVTGCCVHSCCTPLLKKTPDCFTVPSEADKNLSGFWLTHLLRQFVLRKVFFFPYLPLTKTPATLL